MMVVSGSQSCEALGEPYLVTMYHVVSMVLMKLVKMIFVDDLVEVLRQNNKYLQASMMFESHDNLYISPSLCVTEGYWRDLFHLFCAPSRSWCSFQHGDVGHWQRS